jgi:hypothetical protein
METGGEDLLGCRVRQQIAGELQDAELVVGQIGIEGLDHPFAPAAHLAIAVLLVAVAVGVAGEVEPPARLMFAVVRRGEQARERVRPRVGALVGEELVEFGERGRQAGEVERRTPQQRGAIGRRCRRLRGVARCREEGVHRMRRAGDRRRRLRARRCESPVLRGPHGGPAVVRPGRAFLDPAPERRDLRGRQRGHRGVGRRHPLVVGAAGDEQPQFALLARAGNDHHFLAVARARQCGGALIEAQAGLVGGGAVAVEAVLLEDRQHVACEVHRRRRRLLRGGPRQRRRHERGEGVLHHSL